MKLRPYHEFVGVPQNCCRENGQLSIEFLAKFNIVVPFNTYFENKIREKIGRKIGIINVDGVCRVIDINDDIEGISGGRVITNDS